MSKTDYTKVSPKDMKRQKDNLTLIWATNTFNNHHDDFKITFRHKPEKEKEDVEER